MSEFEQHHHRFQKPIENNQLGMDLQPSEEMQVEDTPSVTPDVDDNPIPYSYKSSDISEKIQDLLSRDLSRRDVLIAGGILGAGVAFRMLRGGGIPVPDIKLPDISLPQINTPEFGGTPKEGLLTLGQETDIKINQDGISWAPDGLTPYYINPDNEKVYIVAGNARCYSVKTKQGINFPDSFKDPNIVNNIKQAFGPDPSVTYNNPKRGSVEFRNGYSAITSVISTDNPNVKYGITHNEEWAAQGNGDGFTACVGMVQTQDGGETWQDMGPIIIGNNPKAPELGTPVSGVGEPCGIKIGNDIFIYYIDWTKPVNELYLAKRSLQGTSLGPVEYFTGDGFTTSYVPEALVPVIPLPKEQNSMYTALPDVSYNKKLNQYMALFTTNLGLMQTLSTDGINWGEAKTVKAFDHPKESDPNNWISYFTYLSDTIENTDQITDGTGILLGARRVDGDAHSPIVFPASIA